MDKFQLAMHDNCGEIWQLSTCGVFLNFSTWQMWSNMKFLHMWSNFIFLHMTDVEKSEISPHLACVWCRKCLHICTIYAVCYNLRTFVTKSVLLRFTHFCVEKNLTKNCLCGEKCIRSSIRSGLRSTVALCVLKSKVAHSVTQ